MSDTAPGKGQARVSSPDTRLDDRIEPRVWKIAGVVMLAPLMAQLDSTVVNVSLSTLAEKLDTTLTTIQWVSSGYLLALALTLPLPGWLVDRVGAKRLYLYCFSIFTVTSLFCRHRDRRQHPHSAPHLQGMAGGVLTPMSQMMMARTAGRHMARVMGFAVMPVMIGPILGPTLAGLILQHAGWPWIFLVNLPVGVLATLLAWRVLPTDTDQRVRRNFDVVGFVLLSPGLALLLHSLETIASGTATDMDGIWLELAAAVALLRTFLWHAARRGGAALIDIRLFRARTFAASAATQFLSNCMTYGGQLLFPLYLITARGYTPSRAGILLAAMGIGLICAFPWMGRLTERYGARRVSTMGALIGLIGTLPFVLVSVYEFSDVAICLLLWLRGVGLGSINIPSMSSAYAEIPKERLPVATTALNIVQRLGGPIATTCLAIRLHSSLTTHGIDVTAAFSTTFALFCVLHALGVVAAFTIPVRGRLIVRCQGRSRSSVPRNGGRWASVRACRDARHGAAGHGRRPAVVWPPESARLHAFAAFCSALPDWARCWSAARTLPFGKPCTGRVCLWKPASSTASSPATSSAPWRRTPPPFPAPLSASRVRAMRKDLPTNSCWRPLWRGLRGNSLSVHEGAHRCAGPLIPLNTLMRIFSRIDGTIVPSPSNTAR